LTIGSKVENFKFLSVAKKILSKWKIFY
jgi:hypothetical protein